MKELKSEFSQRLNFKRVNADTLSLPAVHKLTVNVVYCGCLGRINTKDQAVKPTKVTPFKMCFLFRVMMS